MMLAAHDYSYRINGRFLLRQITFGVRAGEHLAVVGPNGAGKSTLLKSFCRIIPKGEGMLSVQGRPLDTYSQKELARCISYVPQAAGRHDHFTVREFVLMGRFPHWSPLDWIRRQDWETVDHALAQAGMTEFRHRQVRTLSGGEQQKVMIAAALVQGAPVMLLDEPAAFLDPYQQDQVYDLLETLRQEAQVTLVEVTHDVNRAALAHDRILGLREGRVVFLGTPGEFMTPDRLYAIYGKRFDLCADPRNGRLIALPETRLGCHA